MSGDTAAQLPLWSGYETGLGLAESDSSRTPAYGEGCQPQTLRHPPPAKCKGRTFKEVVRPEFGSTPVLTAWDVKAR